MAPPRAQLLVWFVLHGRLNTKERLFRFRFPQVEDELCVFCGEDYHIIFGCRLSSSLWYFGCKCWNLAFCLPKDPMACFLTWMDAPFTRFDFKIWSSLFYVISWSIWWLRNKVIFQKMEPNWETEKRLIIWRLGAWTKAWCPEFPFSTGQMCEDLLKARRWTKHNHISNSDKHKGAMYFCLVALLDVCLVFSFVVLVWRVFSLCLACFF